MKKSQRKSGARKKRRPKSIAARNLKSSLRYIPFIAPIAITAFIYAWLHTRMNIVGLPIESLRARKRDLIKQNDSIRLRIEQLQAPARVESIAREKLGMVSPESWQVVAVDEPTRPPGATFETCTARHELSSGHNEAGLFGFRQEKRRAPQDLQGAAPKR